MHFIAEQVFDLGRRRIWAPANRAATLTACKPVTSQPRAEARARREIEARLSVRLELEACCSTRDPSCLTVIERRHAGQHIKVDRDLE